MAVWGRNRPIIWTMPFSFTLDPAATGPLFLQIAARVRAAVLCGRLVPGMRLPSACALAAQLSVNRGMVDAAYALLAGEGAMPPRASAGTVVAGSAGTRIEAVEHTPFMFPAGAGTAKAAPLPLRIGLPALDSFPMKTWSNLIVRAVRRLQPRNWPNRTRAVWRRCARRWRRIWRPPGGFICALEQVVITAGYQGALARVRQQGIDRRSMIRASAAVYAAQRCSPKST